MKTGDLKDNYIKDIEALSTISNYEESLERMVELQTEIDEIMNQKLEKQIDALLEAAKRAGVEGEDLQAAGIEF